MSTTPELHDPEAHEVIAAELVACTLGQRRRPELRMDLPGQIIRAFAQVARARLEAFRRIAAVLRGA